MGGAEGETGRAQQQQHLLVCSPLELRPPENLLHCFFFHPRQVMEVQPTRPPSSPRPSLTCPASLEASSWCCVCRPEDSLPCGFLNPKSRAAMTPCECAAEGLLVYSTPCWPVVSTAPCRLCCCHNYLTTVYNYLHTNPVIPLQPHPQKDSL